MNRVAIGFSTCDRTELSRQSIEPLLQPAKYDLHWIDGSKTPEGAKLPFITLGGGGPVGTKIHEKVYGGSGPAIVYALTAMLKKKWEKPNTKATSEGYAYIGLVENDV